MKNYKFTVEDLASIHRREFHIINYNTIREQRFINLYENLFPIYLYQTKFVSQYTAWNLSFSSLILSTIDVARYWSEIEVAWSFVHCPQNSHCALPSYSLSIWSSSELTWLFICFINHQHIPHHDLCLFRSDYIDNLFLLFSPPAFINIHNGKEEKFSNWILKKSRFYFFILWLIDVKYVDCLQRIIVVYGNRTSTSVCEHLYLSMDFSLFLCSNILEKKGKIIPNTLDWLSSIPSVLIYN